MKYYSLIISFLFTVLSGFAQKNRFDSGEQYVVGNITVTGQHNFNPQTVVTFSGLKRGEMIYIPGERISNVIKKLWDQNLFSDVNIYVTSITGDTVNLEINIVELPSLNDTTITGVRKGKVKELRKELKLDKGTRITQSLLSNIRNYITNKYRKDGFFNTEVDINSSSILDSVGNEVSRNLKIDIDRGPRVKVKDISVSGNGEFSKAKVRKGLKNTKKKNFLRFFKRSKYTEENFAEDRSTLIDKYRENGFRDARIVWDSLIVIDEKNIALELEVEEGNKYYFGDIRFVGNSIYTDQELRQHIGIKKGDVYDGVFLSERIEDNTKPDADDLTNAYHNNGYLFSRINPVETQVKNDTIDFEIRIFEGKLAYINNVSVTGNDRTNDHVIYRELRVQPGQKYSKEAIMRSMRELGQLGIFDAEALMPDIQNVNPDEGTLDIEFPVTEAGSSQIELQGGYGGRTFIGTLGLNFNNFSIRNIFKKDAYRPVPMGDGQTLSLRAQASAFFQTYSATFVEPWFGGKEPRQLSVSFSHTIQFSRDLESDNYWEPDRSRRFLITGGTVGLARRLEWPDNYFTLSHAISLQHINLQNYNVGLFTFGDGSSNNLTYTLALSRDNTFTNPIYPMGGSNFTISAKLSPPYSLLDGVDYGDLENDPAYQLEDGSPDIGKIDQKKFRWLEYYKLKFKGDWFSALVEKLVLRKNVEFGVMGAYNPDRGIPPFEQFSVGGDLMNAFFQLDGREIIPLRGYQTGELSRDPVNPRQDATSTIFNKFSLELRYPITLKPMASIYVLGFAEGGAAYNSFKQYNPFQLYRSAGAGMRIFMPAFGLLGIDFGYGFDTPPGGVQRSGWQTHFMIGQQF